MQKSEIVVRLWTSWLQFTIRHEKEGILGEADARKTMHGALALAFSKRSLTMDVSTPTKSSTNSEAAQEKKGTRPPRRRHA
jgi:hypothetical protein